MKKEMMENATGVKLTKKASKNVIRSLSVGLAAMMALSTPIAAFAEDADGQNSSETTPEERTTTVPHMQQMAMRVQPEKLVCVWRPVVPARRIWLPALRPRTWIPSRW